MSGLLLLYILVTWRRDCLYDVVQNPLFLRFLETTKIACGLVVSRT